MKRLISHLTSPEMLRGAPFYQRYQPPRQARFDDDAQRFHPSIREALRQVGIERLYCHQTEALQEFHAGNNPLIVTPTASGKSLVYQLAILEELQRNPEARILLLFPLKALAQDQLQRLQELINLSGLDQQCSAAVLDGDTPRGERDKLRAHPPNLLLTNPDMLHYGILPMHRAWSHFFRNLNFIVIDELHIYRGIFGSHVLQVLRRLGRICRFYEANPRWIAGSATIGNPLELARDLIGEEFQLVERNGAPASGRHFLLINPTESPYTLASRLVPEIIKKAYKTIVFTKSRRATELLHRFIMESHPELADRLSSYRAGFLPEERRQIEASLLADDLSGVISTSALELGMDIGGIDVGMLLGYPGTISALMQRAGRAGRRERDSLIILLAGEDALDQYFMRHPEQLFLRPSEAAIVDGTNPDISKAHLVCAAAEIPLAEKEPYLNQDCKKQIDSLIAEKKLIPGAGGRRWFPNVPRPHRLINIRSVGSTYSIHDERNGRQVGDIGESRLWSECHPQAIYLHHGRQYQVKSIDDAAKAVYVQPAPVDFYTQALGEKETEILHRLREFDLGCGKAVEGELKVTERVTGFQKRRLFSGQLISTHNLDGPPQILVTRGFWIEMDDGLQDLVETEKFHYMGSLHASEHALISIFPLEVMCDRSDVGGISFTHHSQVGGAAIFVYDSYPGGLGITRRAYERLPSLIGRTLSLINECPCEDGCPSCVHSPRCGAGNRPLDKGGALFILKKLSQIREVIATEPQGDNVEKPRAPLRKTRREKRVEIQRSLPSELEGKRILAFDLETQRSADEVGGWGNVHLMGLSLGVVQDLSNGEFRTYREENVEELIEELFSADLVVGFNCVRFDFGVLSGYTGRDFSRIPVVDLLVLVHQASGLRCSLDALAEANLNQGKSGTGLDALRFYNESRWDELEKYCRRDVEITADIFYIILHEKRLNAPMRDAQMESIRVELQLDELISAN